VLLIAHLSSCFVVIYPVLYGMEYGVLCVMQQAMLLDVQGDWLKGLKSLF
jgi:hypothetical protein